MNNGDGTFTQNTTDVVATDKGWSYGCAFGDMDRDGDLDLAVANCFNETQEDALYENLSSANGNAWLEVELIGTVSNRSAIGAKVWAKAVIGGVEVTQLREVSAQTGYCGQNQLINHFGLGNLGKIESITINWPSGLEEVFGNISKNQFVKITEGQGIVSTKNQVVQAAGFRVFPPSPNPFSDSVSCRFEMNEPSQLLIEVLDNQGVVVKKLAEREFSSGPNSVEWASGGIPAGAYFLRFSTPSGMLSKLVLKK